jgi:hypothetical protein
MTGHPAFGGDSHRSHRLRNAALAIMGGLLWLPQLPHQAVTAEHRPYQEALKFRGGLELVRFLRCFSE